MDLNNVTNSHIQVIINYIALAITKALLINNNLTISVMALNIIITMDLAILFFIYIIDYLN